MNSRTNRSRSLSACELILSAMNLCRLINNNMISIILSLVYFVFRQLGLTFLGISLLFNFFRCAS